MRRPSLLICRSCKPRKGHPDSDALRGEVLFQAVKALRKARGLKPVFALEGVRCLGRCDAPCNLQLEGKRRSTASRTEVNALAEAELVVEAACAYARLRDGEELTERRLPGLSGD
ncbi:MAG: DUF1636 family protein [Archangium sp.]|nr:DUF1636 family protein [Archangium sp.]